VWLPGLCNFTLGAYYAVMLQTVPQLLSADGVPQPTIAQVTAIGMVPSFCSFFVSPILDWRYTRRAYAIALALLPGGALLAMLALLHDMTRLATFMFIGAGAVTLYQAAL
jgi:MFS transporter, PAT family, beta-lactamase induction signal transducer AmpG